MFKTLILLQTIVGFGLPARVNAQALRDVMVIHHTDGTTQRVAVESIESIDFEQEEVPDPRAGIDLGSNVLWAPCNIGADEPQQYGSLFAWGETEVKDDYSETSYRYFTNGNYDEIGYNISGTQFDAATAAWGEPWRMPTKREIETLMTDCTWTAEFLQGVNGVRITAPNGNSIFLPAAGYQSADQRLQVGEQGYYWSATLNRELPSSAYNINFRGYDAPWSANRSYGFAIRAVRYK